MSGYVLIADVDARRLEQYRGMVAQQGLTAVATRDGVEALAALRERGTPAALLTELVLPRADGFSLLAGLRRGAAEAQTPAVVVSAFRELREAAWQRRDALGITELLPKSVPLDAVERALVRALTRPHGEGARPALQRSGSGPVPSRDPERARRLRLAGLMTEAGPVDAELQALLAETADAMRTRIALISIVGPDRTWFRGCHGIDPRLFSAEGAGLHWEFCRHVVDAGGTDVLVVPDARANPAFEEARLVRDFGVRSYAGAPLVTSGGDVLGTLCVADTAPLDLGPVDLDLLQALARRAAGELEVRVPREARASEAAGQGPDSGATLDYLAVVLDTLDQGAVVLSAQRRILLANRAMAELFGLPAESLIGLEHEAFNQLASERVAEPAEFLRRMHVMPTGPYVARAEFELSRPRRRVLRWVTKPLRLPDGKDGQIAYYADITTERELAEKHARLALTDHLTGLLNRRGGEEALAREVGRARRYGTRLSFALFDLDHFKTVNDELGHMAGDQALKTFGQVLTATLRTTDEAVRWGGEEFLVLLPGVGLEGAQDVAERVRRALEITVGFEGLRVTTSVGTSELDAEETPEAAIARADERLYEAKKSGRNCVR